MDLESAHIVERQLVGRSSKILAELGDSADVGSLCRRRHVADAHVLDHTAAKRAYIGHLELLSGRGLATPNLPGQETNHKITPHPPR